MNATLNVPTKHDEDLAHEYEVLYVLFGFVLLGAAVMHLSKVPILHSLPSTVIFFVLGIAFALIAESGSISALTWLMNSYTGWVGVDPHLLLFTFLPPLLFSDAFAIDTHIAKRTSGQCLLLAGPGVVIGSFATAGFCQYCLPYGWDFPTSLMVGSILSATDPVAVVSLLKDLGASPVLTMQIQGESMLNDGTAMVLFTVAYKFVAAEECDAGCVVSYLVKSTLGAWALGMALGYGFFCWIRGASDKLWHKSSLVQIMLTLACAYWSYLLADGLFHMSGVLSTVASALVLSHRMWPAVVEKQAMLEFWHVVETIGNTLVFFLAGMLTGVSIPEHELEDFSWALLAWVFLVGIRFATIAVLWPLLNRAGDAHVSLRDVIVMTWGGLRGLVGLALAILVQEDRGGGMMTKRDANLVLFLVGSVAALTLIINATTAPLLCSVLGIMQTVEGRKALVRNVAKRAEKHITEELDRMIAEDQLPRPCSVGGVREAVEVLKQGVREHIFEEEKFDHDFLSKHRLGRLNRVSSMHALGMDAVSKKVGRPCARPDADSLWKGFEAAKLEMLQTSVKVSTFKFGRQLPTIKRLMTQDVDMQQLKIVREVFLEVLRANYWDQCEGGKFVGPHEPNILLNSASVARDRCGERLADWEILKRYISLDPYEEAALEKDIELKRSGLQTWWQRWRLKRNLASQRSTLQVLTAFIYAHERAQLNIATYFGQDESVDTPEEAVVILESQTEIFHATAVLGKIAKPVQRYMSTAMESYSVCEHYCDFVHKAHSQGVLQGKEASMLLEPATDVLQDLSARFRRMGDRLLYPGTLRNMYEVDAIVAIQRAFRRWRSLSVATAADVAGSSQAPLATLLHRNRRRRPAASEGESAKKKQSEGQPEEIDEIV
eukprot:CAMPEP_0176094428 /NCGR_PEP_ID=MMETSP0120_2-20121206/47319_1 /TAXON_ID=160619 /ORGANISM="Kryptoperidinium foliaceum, Strain CCMP 1326" /LENGTH=888 /DNA_ID=CAMNT_0017428371 /DNA_START=190 /DNA_END=2856 /DNA_ORIENTATION=-